MRYVVRRQRISRSGNRWWVVDTVSGYVVGRERTEAAARRLAKKYERQGGKLGYKRTSGGGYRRRRRNPLRSKKEQPFTFALWSIGALIGVIWLATKLRPSTTPTAQGEYVGPYTRG